MAEWIRPTVHITAKEAGLLQSLVGKPIVLVRTDGFSVQLFSEDLALTFFPDEVYTPIPRDPYYHVSRVAVKRILKREIPQHRRSIEGSNKLFARGPYGEVSRASILSVLICYTKPKRIRRAKALDVELKNVIAWGRNYADPVKSRTRSRAVAEADLGILLRTRDGHAVCIFTDGGFWVDVQADKEGAGVPFRQAAVEVPLTDRGAGARRSEKPLRPPS